MSVIGQSTVGPSSEATFNLAITKDVPVIFINFIFVIYHHSPLSPGFILS